MDTWDFLLDTPLRRHQSFWCSWVHGSKMYASFSRQNSYVNNLRRLLIVVWKFWWTFLKCSFQKLFRSTLICLWNNHYSYFISIIAYCNFKCANKSCRLIIWTWIVCIYELKFFSILNIETQLLHYNMILTFGKDDNFIYSIWRLLIPIFFQ